MTWRVGIQAVCVSGQGVWSCKVKRSFLGIPYRKKVTDEGPAKGDTDAVIKVKQVGNDTYLFFERFPLSHSYRSSFFRPVAKRKTNIEIFTAMLNPSSVRETV